jgi:hypothetical protein
MAGWETGTSWNNMNGELSSTPCLITGGFGMLYGWKKNHHYR